MPGLLQVIRAPRLRGRGAGGAAGGAGRAAPHAPARADASPGRQHMRPLLPLLPAPRSPAPPGAPLARPRPAARAPAPSGPLNAPPSASHSAHVCLPPLPRGLTRQNPSHWPPLPTLQRPPPPRPPARPQSEGSTRARFAAAVAAECIGTFLFALIGGAAPLKNAQTAWANGIALAVLVYATANVSGAGPGWRFLFSSLPPPTRGGRGRALCSPRRSRRVSRSSVPLPRAAGGHLNPAGESALHCAAALHSGPQSWVAPSIPRPSAPAPSSSVAPLLTIRHAPPPRAVTMATLTTGHISLSRALAYMAAQVLGATMASAMHVSPGGVDCLGPGRQSRGWRRGVSGSPPPPLTAGAADPLAALSLSAPTPPPPHPIPPNATPPPAPRWSLCPRRCPSAASRPAAARRSARPSAGRCS
jgi:hypothetical protein